MPPKDPCRNGSRKHGKPNRPTTYIMRKDVDWVWRMQGEKPSLTGIVPLCIWWMLGEKTLNRVFKGGKWLFMTVINMADS